MTYADDLDRGPDEVTDSLYGGDGSGDWPAQDFASEIGWSQVRGIIARTLHRGRPEHQEWLPVQAFESLAETVAKDLVEGGELIPPFCNEGLMVRQGPVESHFTCFLEAGHDGYHRDPEWGTWEMPEYLDWPDIEVDHPELTCDRCGNRNIPSWSIDSDRFNAAVEALGYNNACIICPSCFVLGHEQATRMRTTWTLTPDSPFRHLTDKDQSGARP